MNARLLVPLFTIVIALSVVAWGYIEHEKALERHTQLKPVVEDLVKALRSSMKVGLKVYKNGKLVYHNPDDPISIQWLKLVTNVLFDCYHMGCTQQWLDTGGNTRSYIDTAYAGINPVPIIAIGTGTTASPTDYRLTNQVMSAELSSNYITWTDTGQTYVIDYRYTFIFDTPYNISEAGLLLKVDVDLGSGVHTAYILIAHDAFPTIELNVNDSLTIEYEIVLNYTNPPFTRVFWTLLADYLLGLRGGNKPLSGYGWDTGVDYYAGWGASTNDIHEKIYFAYVVSDKPWSPDITLSSSDITAKWVPRKWVSSVYTDKIVVRGWLIQGDTMNTYTIYGIAIYLYTDGDNGGGNSATYYLLAYIRFNNAPITVDWTKWFDVTLVLGVQ